MKLTVEEMRRNLQSRIDMRSNDIVWLEKWAKEDDNEEYRKTLKKDLKVMAKDQAVDKKLFAALIQQNQFLNQLLTGKIRVS